MKGRFIGELAPGTSFTRSVFLIRDISVRVDRNGSKYLCCTLADRSGSASAKLWSATPQQCEEVFSTRFVLVSGSVQAGQYAGDIVISTFENVSPPDDLSGFLPELPADHVQQQSKFRDLIDSVRNPLLSQLLQTIYAPTGQCWADFCCAVAATSFHHAYRGGLLDHTLEVAQLCEATCTVVPNLRRDFLVTCALLHDIGKLEEMDHGLAQGEYLAAGNLLGHIILGMQRIDAAANSIAGFPIELKQGVLHLILSHHGKLEHGSAKTPLCAEAQVLATNDQLSARLNQCSDALAGANAGQCSTRVRGWESPFIHNGDFGLKNGYSSSEVASESDSREERTLF